MLKFKSGILEALKAIGYNTGRLRREGILGEAQIQRLRENGNIPYKMINRLCELLECQPGDLMEYVND